MRPITEQEIAADLNAMRTENGGRIAPGNMETEWKPRDWLWVQSRSGPMRHGPTMKILLTAVSERTGCSITELRSPRRWKKLVRARMIFYALCKQLTNYSMPQIGAFLGGKDHTTVMHGLRRTAATPDEFQPELGQLIEAFRHMGQET